MSSSLLLGTYVTQEPNTRVQNEITETSHNFYEEHEQSFFEKTSKYLSSISPASHSKLKKCSCCPYGFHIDLDFIRYCEELAANGKKPSRNKRRQRKSMEVMLGFEDQWMLGVDKFEKDTTRQDKPQIQTVFKVFEEFESSSLSPHDHFERGNQLDEANIKIRTDQRDFVNDILFDVYSDFEKSLEHASTHSEEKLNKSSCISREDETICADKKMSPDASYLTRDPTMPSASYSQNVIVENISIEEFHRADNRIILDGKEDKLSRISESEDASNVAAAHETISTEIDRLSWANRKLNDQLQSVRHQLSDNLNRVRDFEERVKLIPKLQLELSVQVAENRDMNIKVKALENALKTKERNDKTTNDIPKVGEPTNATICESLNTKPFNAQRVCATSLESLNVRFTSPVEPQKNHKSVSIQPTTHNVACMTTKTVSRDIGIVTTPIVIQTKTVAVNTNVSGPNSIEDMVEKPKMQNVSVQSDSVSKIQTRNIATITDSEPVHEIEMKSIGVLAIPNVASSACMVRPESRSIGVDNIYQKTKMRTIGSDPIKEVVDDKSIKQNDSPISLKLLDNIRVSPLSLLETESVAEVKTKPKEFRTMGIQHSPSQSHKFTQCKEQIVKLPPMVQSRTESTDTSDLTLLIHRGVNTESPRPTKSRFTNTDPILHDEKSTNTINYLKDFRNSGTNTDDHDTLSKVIIDDKPSELAAFSEHKCHNCLAKIEIKQRTIIKNPNKSHPNIASTSTSLDNYTCSEELAQQLDSQTRIPRPTALISPRSEKKFTRQNTYTIQAAAPLPSESTAIESAPICPAETYLSSHYQTCPSNTRLFAENDSSSENHPDRTTSTHQSRSEERKNSDANTPDGAKDTQESTATGSTSKQTSYGETEERKLWNHSMKSSSTYLQLASRPRQKVKPSKEMQAALKVINDSLLKGQHLETTLKNANKIVQKEWFRTSSATNAQANQVEDYLDYFEEFSPDLLKYIVNLTDANGNTAIMYSVSHGNFDIVSILLDSKVCNINNTNNAGYTCVMLVSLAKLEVAEHQMVVQRLFQMSDVNIRAKKHSQTALMLATSHGNYNMVRMLLDAGADINIQDEDGSTALMCAAEHGFMDIIKILLAQPDCDSTIQDLDGSTALKISLEAGYRDIGVLLYAHEYMIKNKSPYTSLRSIGRASQKPSSSLYSSSSNTIHGHASTSNIASNIENAGEGSANVNKNKR